MKNIKIKSTANAGMLIDFGGNKLLIDAFHNEKYELYPTVSPELFRQISMDPDFSDPGLLIVTHCHPDHFSADMAMKAARLWPDMRTILPEPKMDGILLENPREEIRIKDFHLFFAALPHEPVRYNTVPHYGFIAECNGVTVLDPGDCELASNQLRDFIGNRKIDLAVLNFPWLTLKRGRQFVKEVIRADHLIICHLPDPSEDCFGYAQHLEHMIQKDFSGWDIRILKRPLQLETIDL